MVLTLIAVKRDFSYLWQLLQVRHNQTFSTLQIYMYCKCYKCGRQQTEAIAIGSTYTSHHISDLPRCDTMKNSCVFMTDCNKAGAMTTHCAAHSAEPCHTGPVLTILVKVSIKCECLARIRPSQLYYLDDNATDVFI